MYSFRSRVRYSETDENSRLSLMGAMNYLQDCSTFQSEDLGLGLEYLAKQKKAWWLSAWQVEFLEFPKLGEEIDISTWAYDFNGIYAYRCFAIRDKEGSYLVKAKSKWFFFDLLLQRPGKPGRENIEKYIAAGAKPLDMRDFDKRIEKKGESKEAGEILVDRIHLDSNHHVNNAHYIEMAREVLGEEFKLRQLQAHYKKAAKLGDRIRRRIYEDGEFRVVELAGEGDTVYATIAFNQGEGKS
ncbi:MAG: thioesterase [Johnsonella sp.]|nr:thioesterase [Johnsonella sp.]